MTGKQKFRILTKVWNVDKKFEFYKKSNFDKNVSKFDKSFEF